MASAFGLRGGPLHSDDNMLSVLRLQADSYTDMHGDRIENYLQVVYQLGKAEVQRAESSDSVD